ncbi:glycosyltransferase [Salinimicrobium sp. CDJ15-81-2]|nr:glycosyltransferase [Salinimicrobium nanhaiense]
MLNIIYPYRNRNFKHVVNSLNSLKDQTCNNFQVFFVDYGSDLVIADQVRILCESFSFVRYKFYPVNDQPWNKSKALNSIIKGLKEGYCFVADVDMVFHPGFIKKSLQLQEDQKTIYFQVGFLGQGDSPEGIKLTNFGNYRKSTSEATGLSMFPVDVLQKLRGFDEFYHFWGAEDTDIHVRLKNSGYPVEYFDKEILMLHQWHPSYRSGESINLTTDLQIRGIVQLNHQHLKFAVEKKVTKVNPHGWGEIQIKREFEELEEALINLNLTNNKREINDLLYGQLPVHPNKILKVRITKDPYEASFEYFLKKILKRKVPDYYSLKEINDLILLHIISFYRDQPYFYRISEDLKSINFAIKF